MRRLRVVIVVAALGFGCLAPVVAQAQVETSAWDWKVLAERFAGWAEAAWSAVAAAGEKAPPPGEDDGGGLVVLDGGEQSSTGDDPSTGGEAYPGFDPNG